MNSQLPPAVVRERVKVRMKWFNQTKGFGFVQITGEDGDAFLHASLVAPEQVNLLQPGTSLLCDLARGQRGLIVATVYEIDPSTADPEEAKRPAGGQFDGPRRGRQSQDFQQGSGPTMSTSGEVKFYNSAKGYGFMQADDGGSDIFLPGRVMQNAGIDDIQPQARLQVEYRNGPRGRQAERVELA